MSKIKVLQINYKKPDIRLIKKAARIVKDGGVVIYPTDTCYGIGTSAFDEKAVQKVFTIKGRNFDKPLSVIVRNMRTAKSIAEINNKQQEYFEQKLPGRYTLIFKKKKILSDILTAGENTIGIRIPDYLITELLSYEVRIPFTATSANISDKSVCYSISDFLEQIQDNKILPDLILDAGKLKKNKPSEVIDSTRNKPKILR